MAWNLTLQDASYRGVTFDVQSVEDRGEKALCVHEYPYRSGAEVEDLGRKPRVIPVTAIFWGVAYESRIKALVAAFEEAGPGELIHPVFGSLTVAVRRWQIQHSAERHDYATVTFEAVEAVTDNPFFGATSSRSLAEQALADISSSLDEALGLSESELGKTLGQWADTAANIKARVETELQGVLDVLDAGRSVVRSVLSYVDVPSAFVADAQAIVRGLQADAASASSSVVSAFGVLSTALPLLSLTVPEAVKAYATGAARARRLVSLRTECAGRAARFFAHAAPGRALCAHRQQRQRQDDGARRACGAAAAVSRQRVSGREKAARAPAPARRHRRRAAGPAHALRGKHLLAVGRSRQSDRRRPLHLHAQASQGNEPSRGKLQHPRLIRTGGTPPSLVRRSVHEKAPVNRYRGPVFLSIVGRY